MRHELFFYLGVNGKEPFKDWLDSLRGTEAHIRVQKRLSRIEETGLLGDSKSVGDGVFELRLDFGPGYRVYFGYDGISIVLLLGGGDKKSQSKDIALAKKHLLEYKSRSNKNEKI